MNPSQLSKFAEKFIPAVEKTSAIAKKTKNFSLFLAGFTLLVAIATSIYAYFNITASFWALTPLLIILLPLIALGIVAIVLDDIIGTPDALKSASAESFTILKSNWDKFSNDLNSTNTISKTRQLKKTAKVLWESSSVVDGFTSARFLLSPLFWTLVGFGNFGAIVCIFCLLISTVLHFIFAG